jgi:hypothetical protein
MPAGRKPDDAVKRMIDQLNGFLTEAGRDRNAFGIDPWVPIQGLSPDEWLKRVETWRQLGATHVAVDTMRAGFKSPQQHIEAIRTFRSILK